MADLHPDTMKRCTKCGVAKPRTEFCGHKNTSDKLSNWCKACHRVSAKAWREANKGHRAAYCAAYRAANREIYQAASVRYRAKNPEKHRAAVAAWQAANPEKQKAINARWRKAHPDKIRANWAAWNAENPGRAAAAAAAWLAANRDRLKQVRAAWAASNLERYRAYQATRRAQKRQAGGKHTADDVLALLKLQRGKCAHAWCKASLAAGYQVDHIVPLAKGGSNARRNLQLLCQPCNNKKWAHDPIDFAQRHGLLL